MIDADRAFFAANPRRRHYARWCGDLEEMAFRKLWRKSTTEVGRAFVLVQQVAPGFRIRQPHFVPLLDIELPTSEDDCAALHGCKAVMVVFGDEKPTIVGL